MRRLLRELLGQEGSIVNARVACTELAARHVERDQVELFLREHLERHPGRRSRTA